MCPKIVVQKKKLSVFFLCSFAGGNAFLWLVR